MINKWLRTHIQLVTVLLIAFLFIFVTVIAIVLTVPKKDNNHESSEETNQTVSFPEISLPDDIFNDFICDHQLNDFEDSYFENDEELIYSYASYPVISSENSENTDIINNSIYEFVVSKSSVKEHEIILAIEKFERASMNAEGFIQFEFILKTESVIVKEKFISILFSYSRTVSLSEPTYEYFSLCFDLTSGEEADFSDIIAKNAEESSDYIASIISQDILINPNIYYTNAKDDLKYCIDLNSFYLSDNGAVIYFNPETLTPGVYGIRTFLVPYEKIGYKN